MKEKIIEMLLEAGFEREGKNQLVHPKHGRLHFYEWAADELVKKLMQLGAVHQTHEIKQALHVKEEFSFQPTA